jgi:DNA-binding response OmpR family regulator
MEHLGILAVDSLRGVYVLICDGDHHRRLLLARVLEYCGAYVQTAADSDKAFLIMRQMLPDVLIADVDAIGCELVRDVRALKPEAGGTVPVIGIGARDREDASRSGGCDAFLPSPFVAWDVCGLVSRLTAD